MSNSKAPISFEIITTADGSPTLSLSDGEKMHSLEGALSESLYIYAPCVEKAMQWEAPAHILSMGLGLGYNEFITFAQFLKQAGTPDFIASFESVPFLRQSLQDWLSGIESPLDSCYDSILSGVCRHFEIEAEDLKQQMKISLEQKSWLLLAELPTQNPCENKFNVVFYDAFSGGTDPTLWTENHFDEFLNSFCHPQNCILGTYAATGALKRSLKKNSFQYEKKKGFGVKRESTFALRETF